MRIMHLFAGAGGGLLADLILGHEPVIAVEWDPYCCAILRERAADGWWPELRVHEGDVRLFDPSPYAGQVDCISAGFPCQDISVAGHGAGIGEGTRSGLYREVLKIAGIVRPGFLFMENSPAILANELLGTVLRDLAASGYDARWTCLPASAIGAPHYRDRWWCVAEHADTHCEWKLQSQGSEQDQRYRVGDLDENVAYPEGEQSGCGDTQEWAQPREGPTGSCGDGVGWWATEPGMGRVAHGVAHRAHRIKALGNGQVPIQAATAWIMLGGPYDWRKPANAPVCRHGGPIDGQQLNKMIDEFQFD